MEWGVEMSALCTGGMKEEREIPNPNKGTEKGHRSRLPAPLQGAEGGQKIHPILQPPSTRAPQRVSCV